LLQQLLPSALLHDFAQPVAFASLSLAHDAVFAAVLEQHDFADASLPLQDFSVLALSAEVTFCADAVLTVKEKIKANNEITSAIFFIGIIY
jgi:hypothetical protein